MLATSTFCLTALSLFILLLTPAKQVLAQQRSAYDLAAWIIAAVPYYDTASVNWALKEGGQIDFKRAGMNALEMAMYYKKTEMIKFLLQKGASIDSVNQDGMNALQYAEKIGNAEVIELIKAEMKITAPVPSDTAKNNPIIDEKKPTLPPVTTIPVVLNAYKIGDKVLISRTRGKSWEPGTIKEISTDPGVSEDGTPMYMVENIAKTAQQYLDLNFITTLTRQPTWTSFFIGDWDLHAPIAAVDREIERDVYTIISGGDRFPPIRINANGTYSWVIDKNKIIKGKWIQNEDAPGILLLKGYRGVNWSVYNSSDKNNRKIFKTDYIIITDEKGMYLSNHGFRIK